MINIEPYQNRLKLCYEWICHKIDGTLPLIGDKEKQPFYIDIGAIPKVSWEEAVRIYEQTGVLFWNANVPNNMHPASFEEYCEFNIKIKNN